MALGVLPSVLGDAQTQARGLGEWSVFMNGGQDRDDDGIVWSSPIIPFDVRTRESSARVFKGGVEYL